MAKTKAAPLAESTTAVEGNRLAGFGSGLPRLRELGHAQNILDAWLVETEGEETPAIAELWQQLQGEKEAKVGAWGMYLLGRYATADLMKAEADFYLIEGKRLQARLAAFEKATAKSEQQLQFQLELQGIPEVVTPYVTVKLQDNPPKVVGDPPEGMLERMYADPDLGQFVRYTPESFELDRNAVKDEAKNHPAKLAAWLPSTVAVIRAKRVVVR